MADFRYYKNRRAFSDAVHSKLVTKVYNYLEWELDDSRDENYQKQADLKDGIDYYVLVNGFHRTVQERFRTASNSKWDDITFRYQYPENTFYEKNSEWFKITAHYFLYGVVDQDTTNADEIKSDGKFLKLVVIDLRIFYGLLEKGKIMVGKDKFSQITDGKLIGGFNTNVSRSMDNRSTFVVFNVGHLYEIDNDMIIVEKGYGTPKDICNIVRGEKNEV